MTKRKLPIPTGVFDQHIAVLGKTRSGKSSTMRLLVESLLEKGEPVCIIDPKGDWWGLRLSADGKSEGYPVVIFGTSERADVAINDQVGADVAELVATGNRPSLIDFGGWTVAARTRFYNDFAQALFKHTVGDRWLVVDEIHNFAPCVRATSCFRDRRHRDTTLLLTLFSADKGERTRECSENEKA